MTYSMQQSVSKHMSMQGMLQARADSGTERSQKGSLKQPAPSCTARAVSQKHLMQQRQISCRCLICLPSKVLKLVL